MHGVISKDSLIIDLKISYPTQGRGGKVGNEKIMIIKIITTIIKFL